MRLEQDPDGRSWSSVRGWIDEACTHCDGWWTIEAVENLLVEGKALLWVLTSAGDAKAAVVTAICDWDGRKVAEIMLTGGTGVIESMGSELPAIEHWARDNGAVEIYARGRRGWARLYKPLGYDEISVTMRKAL